MKVVNKNGKDYVFDEIRKKYLVLTPEEKVRQQVVAFLIHKVGYPKASISLEKSIKLALENLGEGFARTEMLNREEKKEMSEGSIAASGRKSGNERRTRKF